MCVLFLYTFEILMVHSLSGGCNIEIFNDVIVQYPRLGGNDYYKVGDRVLPARIGVIVLCVFLLWLSHVREHILKMKYYQV